MILAPGYVANDWMTLNVRIFLKMEETQGVIGSGLERVEGFSKGKIANDVKGCEIVPLHYVNHSSVGSGIRQPCHEQIDVGGNKVFLLFQGLLGKRM